MLAVNLARLHNSEIPSSPAYKAINATDSIESVAFIAYMS